MSGDMTTVEVRSARLSGPAEYELTALSVSYSLNGLGEASAVLALGTSFEGSKTSFELPASAFSETWTITVTTGSGSHEVFSGLLMGLQETMSASAGGSRLSIQMSFSGKGAKLRTINASAYRQWGATNSATKDTADDEGPKVKGPVFEALDSEVLQSLEVPSPTDDMVEFLLEGFAKCHEFAQTQSGDAKELLDFAVEKGDAVKLSESISIDDDTLESSIDEEFLQLLTQAYGSMDLLAALTSVANTFYLQIVPRSDGKLRVLPILPWMKKEDASIDIDDIISCGRSMLFENQYQAADHVLVFYPPEPEQSSTDAEYAIWPEDSNEKPGKAKIISLPSWLTSKVAAAKDAEEEGDPDETGQRVQDNAEGDSSSRQDANKQYAKLLAKAEFATHCGSQETYSLQLRWDRLEYLDKVGYIVRMPRLQDSQTQSEDMFGMISGVELAMNVTQGSGNSTLRVSISSARPSSVNDKLALDEHPIYQAGGVSDAMKEAAQNL